MWTKMQAHGERNGYGEKHQDGSPYALEVVRSNVGEHCGYEVDDETDAGHNPHQRPADSKNEAECSCQLKSCSKGKVMQGNTNVAVDSANGTGVTANFHNS